MLSSTGNLQHDFNAFGASGETPLRRGSVTPLFTHEDQFTSPQSVLEDCSRPSRASSIWSQPSSTTSFSQPATPSPIFPMNEVLGIGGIDEHNLRTMYLQSDHFARATAQESFLPLDRFDTENSIGLPMLSNHDFLLSSTSYNHPDLLHWTNVEETPDHVGQEDPDAGLAMFRIPQPFKLPDGESTSLFDGPMTSVSNLVSLPLTAAPAIESDPATSPIFLPPQGVAPSQVTPLDQFSDLDYITDCSPNSFPADFSSNLVPSLPNYISSNVVGVPSPDATPFDQVGEGNYLNIEQPHHVPTSFGCDTPGIKKKRVLRKRSNKIRNGLGANSQRIHNPYCELTIGRGLTQDPKSGAITPTRIFDSSKNFQCPDCGHRTSRKEHLTRHAKRHTTERPFPCPVDGCDLSVQRSDNALQHFITHLKNTASGRRNGIVAWRVLKQGIRELYSRHSSKSEMAKKMLTNLEKWIWKHPEGQYQREIIMGLRPEPERDNQKRRSSVMKSCSKWREDEDFEQR